MDIQIHEMKNSKRTFVKSVESLRVSSWIGRFVGCIKKPHGFGISLTSQWAVDFVITICDVFAVVEYRTYMRFYFWCVWCRFLLNS